MVSKQKYFKCVTQPFSVSYPSLHKPNTEGNFPSNKYEVTALLDETEHADTLTAIKSAVNSAFQAEWADQDVSDKHNPIRKQPDGTYKIKFKTKSAPILEDATGSKLSDGIIIGSGDLVRCACNVAAYSGPQSGVTIYLNKVRLIEKRSIGDGVDDFGGPEDGFNQATAETASSAINF
jgi:hypothetical protein